MFISSNLSLKIKSGGLFQIKNNITINNQKLYSTYTINKIVCNYKTINHINTLSTFNSLYNKTSIKMISNKLSITNKTPVFFLCDIQEKFRPHIYEFDSLCKVSNKLISYARILNAPIFATEQVPEKFGKIVSDVGIQPVSSLQESNSSENDATSLLPVYTVSKTKFSMVVPELENFLHYKGISTTDKTQIVAIVFGLESHVCVLQTVLSLLEQKYTVMVSADAISSIIPEQRSIAIRRMEQAGAIIGTSESILFELMGDASNPKFKALQKTLMKPDIKANVKTLLSNL